MKKLKEINLSPSLGRGVSPHVKGKQPYYSGYSGGMTDSAASASSSLMGSKKVKIDLEEESEESQEEIDLMPENILNLRVRTENGYSLNETLALLNKNQINESFVGDKIYQGISVLLMSLLDDATAEVAGLVAVIPLLYKNVYELHQTNKAIDLELKKGATPDAKKLKNLRSDLITDVVDILNAIVIALPIPAVDTVAASIISLLDGQIVGSASSLLIAQSKNYPLLSKILYVLSYPLGGKVIFKALSNIDNLSGNSLDMQLQQNNSYEEDINPIDMSSRAAISEIINVDIHKLLKETLNEKDYYGIDEDLEEDLDLYSDLDEEEAVEVEEQHVVGGFAAPLETPTKAQQEKLMTFKEDLQRLQDWHIRTAGRKR
tara:strand:+ start:1382 stop:2506 length:1125 start_codon:yes stop_codon:yes gene_type:complete